MVALFRTLTTGSASSPRCTPVDLGVATHAGQRRSGPVVQAGDGLTSRSASASSAVRDGSGSRRTKTAKLKPRDGPSRTTRRIPLVPRRPMLQLGANNRDTVQHALRDIAKHNQGRDATGYSNEGFNRRPASAHAQPDGLQGRIVKPTGGRADRLVWGRRRGWSRAAWATGGSLPGGSGSRMLRSSSGERVVAQGAGETCSAASGKAAQPQDWVQRVRPPETTRPTRRQHISLTRAQSGWANPRTARPKTDGSTAWLQYAAGCRPHGNIGGGCCSAGAYQQDWAPFEATKDRWPMRPW